MKVIQELLIEYVRMRDNGMDAKAALYALRPYVEPLSEAHKAELADNLRHWESQSSVDTHHASSPIKPLKRRAHYPSESLLPKGLKPGATWIACPNCQRKNKVNEVFCFACGHLIDSGQGVHNTRNFTNADLTTIPPEHFGSDSVLILWVRDSGRTFTLRPQNTKHEMVIGRSNPDIPMKPDVDLNEDNAEALGVSRLHCAIAYSEENKTLLISDLGSANGSFINGQKLHPSEQRVLRNGDEIRMAHLITRATYEHPGQEVL